MYDVIIAGGGPAGLSGALVLGRCKRKVAVFDTARPRNRFSKMMHGFLTRDGIEPLEFLKLARKDLKRYNIDLKSEEIISAKRLDQCFQIETNKGNTYHSKKFLLTTGLIDNLPPIDNIMDFYGTCVFHCPYCDGWEVRNKPLAAYGKGKNGYGLSLSLKTWSDDVILITEHKVKFSTQELDHLNRNNIQVYHEKIKHLHGTKNGKLSLIELESGEKLKRSAMFFSYGSSQHCNVAHQLCADFTKRGVVRANKLQETNIKGFYVAGDAARDMQLVIVAAAEGTKAAVAINMALQQEEI